jgi:hypothetical protein
MGLRQMCGLIARVGLILGFVFHHYLSKSSRWLSQELSIFILMGFIMCDPKGNMSLSYPPKELL